VAATAQRYRHDDTMLSQQLQKMAILRRLSRSDGRAGNLVLRDEQRFVYIVMLSSIATIHARIPSRARRISKKLEKLDLN